MTIGQSTVIRWAGRAVAAPTLIGVSTLAAGAVYYLSVRPMAIAAGFASTDAQRLPVIAMALGSLPTFLHVLAFSLLAGALGAATASGRVGPCAAWVGVNTFFEVGQLETAANALAVQLDNWCGTTTACIRIGQYFLHGTFDIADIVAGALGGVLAYTVLKLSFRRTENWL